MLYKYKKAYVVENDDIINPDPETCILLLNINHMYINDGNRILEASYILCGDDTNTPVILEIMGISEELITETLNVCIKEGSLYLNGTNITDESLTIVSNFEVQVDFESCDNPCNGVKETISVINNVIYNPSTNSYDIYITSNSDIFVQYTLNGVDWLTHPSLFLQGDNMVTINGITSPTAIRLISRCEELVSNEWNLTETYCYQAIYDCDNTLYVPPGGTITYIDSAGEEVTESGLCNGEIVMIEANAIISTSGVVLVDCDDLPCNMYSISVPDVSGESISVEYAGCDGVYHFEQYYWGSATAICARNIVSYYGLGSVTLMGEC